MFRVEKGAGAFMNNTRLRVSGRKELSGTVAGLDIGRPVNSPERLKAYTDVMTTLHLSNVTTRNTASAALDSAYMAAGRYDIFYLFGGAKPWDIAAGLLMIKEAGGIATTLQMKQAHHDKGEVLAANPALFKKLVEVLKIAA
jgi:myo-inositol-1(or 4)-monophosphatase